MKKQSTLRLAGQEGMTLIEIMIVIAILGMLASLIAVSAIHFHRDAQITATQLQIQNLGEALKLYARDCNRYPSTAEGLAALTVKPSSCPRWKRFIEHSVPADPWGNPYDYQNPGTHGDEVEIRSRGPDGIPDTSDDIVSWEKAAPNET